jgi:lysozyme
MPNGQVFGIDVSKWQTNVKWDRVKAAGAEFVFVKASESGFADPKFKQHWADSKSVGLPRGAYHFYRQAIEAQKQIDIYLKTLGDDPGELTPVLDIEDTSSKNAASMLKGSLQFLQAIEQKLQRQPMIYTAKWYWDGPQVVVGGKYPDWAKAYPLWVASYPFPNGAPTLDQIVTQKLKPRMPSSWKKWAVWQFAEKGAIDGNFKDTGALANTDFNLFNGALDNLLRLATGEPIPMTDGTTGDVSFSIEASQPMMLNQQMLNAFSWAFGPQLSAKLAAAKLSEIVNNREEPYSGPAIAALPGLSANEKKLLQEKWDAILAKQ